MMRIGGIGMRRKTAFKLGGMVVAAMIATPALSATCEDMASFKAADLTVTKAETVTSLGSIAANMAQTPLDKPFCRVAGYLAPTADSHIQFELWLPDAANWNGKFQTVGNGGFLGVLNYRAALPGLKRNYATMTSDLGHINKGGAPEDPSWADGHPDKVVDYAYRGQHLSVLAAKAITAAYYGKSPAHAYFTGCSAGGISGLTELLRYPTDFDGYVIGDAVADHFGQEIGALWNTLEASLKYPDQALTTAQLGLIHAEVLRQCAGKDGGLSTDPFLTNPIACKFRPEALNCKTGQDAAACLSPQQVAILKRIYGGPVNPRTGQSLVAGMSPGSELGWDKYFTGKKNPATADRPWGGFLMYMAFQDATYLPQQKYLTFDFDKDVTTLRAKMVGGETLESSWNTPNRNLEAFQKAGGKVIQYHGWDDPNIPSPEAVKFLQSLVEERARHNHLSQAQAAAATAEFYRLFMVQGMGHCTGGDGPWSFGQGGGAGREAGGKPNPQTDTLAALEQWVEKGVAPASFTGSRVDIKAGTSNLSRPICAYPTVPVWKGSGSTTEAANFACMASGSRPQAKQ
jgi:feruloyl esterase